MSARTRLQIAQSDILQYFETADRPVYTRRELSSVLEENRGFWRLAQRTTVDEFIKFLREKGQLQDHEIKAEKYPETMHRYTWGDVSNLQLALSIRPNSYISHGTAMYLHGLTDLVPKTIYINKEQSPKPSSGKLSQKGIELAFSRKQRTSNLSFKLHGATVVVINGKNTNRLEVESIKGPDNDLVDCTSLERTLIDIVVRPAYAGGVRQVVEAYKDAKNAVSVNRLKATLIKLRYTYPYHQAIGFIMEYAGYAQKKIEMLSELGIDYDFYLTHGMKEPRYSNKWHLYFPREFEALD